MKRIMSHNTWSYLPVRQWWLRPFRRLAQCQEVSAQEQMRMLEAGGFDLRVRFDREGQPHFAHGLIEYEGDVFEELLRADYIHGVDRQLDRNLNPFYVRVLLETTPLMSRYTRAFQEMRFWSFCDLCRDKYRNLRFWGGWPRDEWRGKVYSFCTIEPNVHEEHASVSGCRLNVLRLRSWARHHNAAILQEYPTGYVMIDYINLTEGQTV